MANHTRGIARPLSVASEHVKRLFAKRRKERWAVEEGAAVGRRRLLRLGTEKLA